MKLRTRKKLIALYLTAPLLVLPLAAQAQSGISDIGWLDGYAYPTGISADGSTVVGYSDFKAFTWTQASGVTSLGFLNGGPESWAFGISSDGSVIVGYAKDGAAGNAIRAFRWTSGDGMTSLGALNEGTASYARDVSSDGSVIIGFAKDGAAGDADRAFRWTSGSGMTSLGFLNGGQESRAFGISSDGSVIVGYAEDGAVGNAIRAFRWTNGGGMTSLGVLNGGTESYAQDVSSDGSVIVGYAKDGAAGNADRAFRWTSGSGMTNLGVLSGGTASYAWGVSSDGRVVVGGESYCCGSGRAFRWTEATGLQSIGDWLRSTGITVASDTTAIAFATNSDGSVVVGQLANGHAFIARVDAAGSGLVSLADVQDSLASTASGGSMALRAAGMVLNGAHSRPLSRRVAPGQKTFWLAGDWGADDHDLRNGDLGLAELGFGRNFGPAQVNAALGRIWAKQDQVLNGLAETDGAYLLAEALIPVRGKLWATLGSYGHWGEADIRRGYLNAGLPDASSGSPDVTGWGLRARLDWDQAWRVAGADFSPYADLTYGEAKLDAYTETGGGFPSRFDARTDKATDLHLGMNAARPLDNGLRLIGTLEAVHRFESTGPRTSGTVVGLFGFDLPGADNKPDWLRVGAGVEGKLGGGQGSLMVNATTQGEAASYWLAANWQTAF